jgi:hypothetical protein
MRKRWIMLFLDLIVGTLAGIVFGLLSLAASLRGSFLSGLRSALEGWLVVGLPDFAEGIYCWVILGGFIGFCVWLLQSAYDASPTTLPVLSQPLPRWFNTLVLMIFFSGLFLLLLASCGSMGYSN